MMHRSASAAALALLLGLGACDRGNDEAGNNAAEDLVITTGQGNSADGGAETVSVDVDSSVANAAATPMNERVAVLGILNKRNGEAREFRLKPGQAGRIGDVIVRLRACDRTAPWEADQLTGAFLQVDVLQLDKSWRRVFSGWVYKERPALNVVQHPIYDVWPKSCAMTFRESGADTVSAPVAGSGQGARSSARKSAVQGSPEASPAEPAPSAAPSNAT